MLPVPVAFAFDKSIAVPQGAIVRTGYVDVFAVRLACRERMAIGDVSEAYQKRLQLGDCEPFPCPTGYWEEGIFILIDGRHGWIANVMLGKTHILVSWLEEV
jgi:hypothetical protein